MEELFKIHFNSQNIETLVILSHSIVFKPHRVFSKFLKTSWLQFQQMIFDASQCLCMDSLPYFLSLKRQKKGPK